MGCSKNLTFALTTFVGLLVFGTIFFIGTSKHSQRSKTAGELLEPMKCYSPFDVYVVYDYSIEGEGEDKILITKKGRVYPAHDCREYEGKYTR